MKYNVHRSIKPEKKDYIEFIIIISILYLIIFIPLLLLAIEMNDFFIFLFFSLALILIPICTIFFRNYSTQNWDYIYFNETDFKLHYVCHKIILKKYSYSSIRILYVDDVEKAFYPSNSILTRSYINPEMWTFMYGKYISALDAEKNCLFSCRYSDELWEFLLKRCEGHLDFVMNEEEFMNFKEERKKFAEKIEQETMLKGVEEYYRNQA